MDNKCEKCGGELVEGKLGGMYLTCFYPKGEEKKVIPQKASKMACSCCKACGLIQNIRAIELEKLN